MSTTNSVTGDRLLLSLDILGFKKIVEDNTDEKVSEIINHFLIAADFQKIADENLEFIYFSDTLILYTQPCPRSLEYLINFRKATSYLYCRVLAAGIPVNGAIAYGQFVVRPELKPNGGEREIYFGTAFNEAHEMADKEKWIGIIICPSAAKLISSMSDQHWESDHAWRPRERHKETRTILVNPFYRLRPTPPQLKGEKDLAHAARSCDLDNELMALGFLSSETTKFVAKGIFGAPPGIAARYHTTLAFAREMLGEECFDWAISEGKKLFDAGGDKKRHF